MGEDFRNIRFELNDGVATVMLNRPERLNSFNDALHAELRGALDRIRADKTVRALVITGAGFVAGVLANLQRHYGEDRYR
ncbi:MAG: enoyl-CoA hydratase-related protein, partial [Candidatus Binataceae bacterium]